MQVIGQSEAGQRSFELQDCANHLHSKLVQLAQHHKLLGHSSAAGPDMLQDTPESRSADGAEGSSSAADATARRRAQAKARQVMYYSSGVHLL